MEINLLTRMLFQTCMTLFATHNFEEHWDTNNIEAN